MEPSAFTILSASWQLEGVQAWCFRLGRGVMFGVILALMPLEIMARQLDNRPLAQGIEQLERVGLLAAVVLGLLGTALEIRWWRGAATAAVRRKRLVIQRGRRKQEWALAGFRSGLVVSAAGDSGARGYLETPVTRFDAMVELEARTGNRLHLQLPSLAEAHALLAATRLDARHRTTRVTLGPGDFITIMLYLVGPAFAALAMTLLGLLVALTGWELATSVDVRWWLMGLSFLGLRALVRALVMPARLTIGHDGVTIEGDLRHRFLSFAVLHDWIVQPGGVLFLLHDGRQVRAHARHLHLNGLREALIARLEEARQIYQQAAGREEVRPALARGTQSLEDWRRGLGALLDRSGYRDDGGLRPEDLREVLASPAEPAEARLGAAIVLRAAGDELLPGRLRALAATCASPRLRVAFERLADGEVPDEELEAAMAEDVEREAMARVGEGRG